MTGLPGVQALDWLAVAPAAAPVAAALVILLVDAVVPPRGADVERRGTRRVYDVVALAGLVAAGCRRRRARRRRCRPGDGLRARRRPAADGLLLRRRLR